MAGIVDERFRGCLVGLALGDALGAAVEFKAPGTFAPVTGLRDGGVFGLEPGEWTDDTSMALCLGVSLIELGEYNPTDVMQRWVRWYMQGYLSVTGVCFDIGNTTAVALRDFANTSKLPTKPKGVNAAGNGAIMRLAPVAMAYAGDWDKLITTSVQQAALTHGGDALGASAVLGLLLGALLVSASKEHAATIIKQRTSWIVDGQDVMTPVLKKIVMGDYRRKTDKQVYATGYSIDTLEAALWAFFRYDSFQDCILAAVNLGGDADTVGAVCGALCGAFYGIKGIPSQWQEQLVYGAGIADLGSALRLLCFKKEKTFDWTLGAKTLRLEMPK